MTVEPIGDFGQQTVKFRLHELYRQAHQKCKEIRAVVEHCVIEPHRAQDLGKVAKIIQLYPKVKPRNTVNPGSCLFAKPFTGKGNKSNSTSETLNNSSAEIGSAPAVDHHVHERIMFHLAYKTRESARLIQLDTQDPVHLDAQGAIDQDLGRAYQNACWEKEPIFIVVSIERVQQETLMVGLVV